MTSSSQYLVVLAAGGTGGHVFPAESLAVELQGRGCRLALITDRRGDAYGGTLGNIETHRVRAGGIAGKSFQARIRSASELIVGTWQARRLLKDLRPQAVVGFGGYASIPTMMAATFGGYNTMIHEQNAILGRANRVLASRVDKIATSFADVRSIPKENENKVVYTGMPVRPAINEMREASYPELNETTPIRILVLGGSQGARVLSEVLPQAFGGLEEGLRKRLDIVQQCRPEDLESAREAYRRFNVKATLSTFFDDIPEIMTSAHLLISRAGASTVAEATAIGRPAILVPYPYATDDHQSFNAHALDECGGGWLMSQDVFTPELVLARLQSLLQVPELLRKAANCAHAAGRPNAAERLADTVFDMLKPNGNAGQGPGNETHQGRAA